jgi:NAD(P)-dependent dehydrogenase (short-subunit alcohol dehydrogenase family)
VATSSSVTAGQDESTSPTLTVAATSTTAAQMSRVVHLPQNLVGNSTKAFPAIVDRAMRALTEEFISHIPLRRMVVPDDIATVAVLLASSASDYITGETVIVDGGRLLG